MSFPPLPPSHSGDPVPSTSRVPSFTQATPSSPVSIPCPLHRHFTEPQVCLLERIVAKHSTIFGEINSDECGTTLDELSLLYEAMGDYQKQKNVRHKGDLGNVTTNSALLSDMQMCHYLFCSKRYASQNQASLEQITEQALLQDLTEISESKFAIVSVPADDENPESSTSRQIDTHNSSSASATSETMADEVMSVSSYESLDGLKETPAEQEETHGASTAQAEFPFLTQGVKCCPICHKEFKSDSSYSMHYKTMHLKLRPYRCTEEGCNMDFGTKGSLKQHISTHKDEGSRLHVCSFFGCARSFNSKYKLQRHELKHVGKPYLCEVPKCNMTFKSQTQLDKHRTLYHNNDKRFTCEQCDKAFPDNKKLKQHVISHSEERPFKCSEVGCSSTFKRACTLKTHRLLHTGEKQFICTICSKGFLNKERLNAHAFTHQNRAYKCTISGCNKEFLNQKGLDNHMKKIHPTEGE